MKKGLLLLTLLAGMASAQIGKTWEGGLGTYTFQGCERSGSEVICTLSFVQNDADTRRISVAPSEFLYYKPDGTTSRSTAVAIAGKWQSWGAAEDIGRDIPISVQFRFPYPNNASTIRRLIILGQRFDNLPIKSAAQPAAKPAATTNSAINLNGSYNATLSNCKVSGATTTCTITFKR